MVKHFTSLALALLASQAAIAANTDAPRYTAFDEPMQVLQMGKATAYSAGAIAYPDSLLRLGMDLIVNLPSPSITKQGTAESFRVQLDMDCDLDKWTVSKIRIYDKPMAEGMLLDSTEDEPPARIFWNDIQPDKERDTVLKAVLNKTATQVCGTFTLNRELIFDKANELIGDKLKGSVMDKLWGSTSKEGK